ncbi:hypothetical protein HZS_3708, partial [Henneguya salminicola]
YLYQKYIDTSNDITYLTPFNIYKNLLISCFQKEESYLKFIEDDYMIKDNNDFILNQSSKNFIDILLQNLVHIHIREFLLTKSVTEEIIVLKASAIKCLLILTGTKRFIRMLSCMNSFLEIDLPKALLDLCDDTNNQLAINEIIYLATTLIYRVQIYSKKNYLLPLEKLLQYNVDSSFLCRKIEHIDDIKYISNKEIKNTENEPIKKQKTSFKDNEIENKYFSYPKKSINESIFFQSNQIYKLYSELYNRIHIGNKHKVKKLTYVKIINSNYIPMNIINRSLTNIDDSHYNIYHGIYNQIGLNKIYKSRCTYKSNAAKFTIDDKILINDMNGLKLYDNNIAEALYKNIEESLIHIDHSKNGELILASANKSNSSTLIWKYTSIFDSFEISASQIYSNLIMGKFSNNNKSILGINMGLNINIYDINCTTIIREYKNNETNSYDLHNTIELNMDDSLMFYNGDLYCIRSGIKIHTFDKLTRNSAGIFMPFDNYVLISNYLFDLRTLQVLDSIEHLKNAVVKRTYDDNILLACSISKKKNIVDYATYKKKMSYRETDYGNTLSLFTSNTLRELKKYDFGLPIRNLDISRDSTQLIICINEDYDAPEYFSFRILCP